MPDLELPQGTIRFRDTGGAGPVIVLVHGALVDGRIWDRVVERLAPVHRCVVPDLPLGAHELPLAAGADRTVPGMAELLADFVAALDLRDVTLVGNDSGGLLCQLVAARRPERVGRLVLTPTDAFDTFPPAPFRPLVWASRVPGGLTAYCTPLRLRPARGLPIAFGWLAKRRDRALEDAWVGRFFASRAVRRDVSALFRRAHRRITRQVAEELRAFDRPALILWPPEDRLFGFELAERLAALLPAGRLEPLEDAYSFVMLDQPDRTAESIAAFVAETSAVAA